MIGGPIRVESIRWNEHTMDLRAVPYHSDSQLTLTIAYKHVSISMMMDVERELFIETTGGGKFCMGFADGRGVRDAAAELARRMEAVR